MTVQAYNAKLYPMANRAKSFLSLFESAINHMDESKVDKEEVRYHFEIRGWSEETKQFLLEAVEYYREHEGLKKLNVYDKSFIDACLCGEALPENIDDYVEYWHNNNMDQTLREFLGFTKEEYQEFAVSKLTKGDVDLINTVLECRKNNMSFDEWCALHEDKEEGTER